MIDSLDGRFLPATRKDFIDIATACDAIANKCESTAVKMVNQHFRFPAQYIADLNEIIAITQKQFAVLSKSISLLFSKFGELLSDHSILDEVRDFESQVDVIEQRILSTVFTGEGDLAEKQQLYNFIELVCDPSDIIENIADKIQIMLITRKA